MKITSIRVDPDVAKIVEVLGLSYQRVLKRGLVSYALEGKIKDPMVLAAVERYQGNLISWLEAEKKIMDLLMSKRIEDNEDKEPKSETGQFLVPICQFCDRDMKRTEDGLYYCTCGSFTKMKNQGLLGKSLVEREYSTTSEGKEEYSTTPEGD